VKESLSVWTLFFVIAGYQYFPEDRVAYQKAEMLEIAGRLNVRPVPETAQVSAADLNKLLKIPSGEPYWKMRLKGLVTMFSF